MKIAILTSGILPVPAVQGGAVENFLDFFLEYNNKYNLHDITVYSIYHPKVKTHSALSSKCNKYIYVDTNSIIGKLRKRIFGILNKNTYHHYSIEYFLHRSITHLIRYDYDIIILNNRPGFAEILAEKTSAKLIYNLYNDKLNDSTRNHEKIYNAAYRIITTSNYITKRVKTINPNDSKCITVYSGIELDNFSRKHPHVISRDNLNIPKESFVLVFSGRITKEKGILELIEAMLILKDIPHITLLVIGSSFYGNANNSNEFANKLKAKSAPLKNRIIFTGFIPYENIPNYLNISDIAIIPSIWDDPFPTTVLEAQAMGLPIITTRRGGIPEEVTTDNAILLETDKHFVNNLAKAITELYNNPERRKKMSEASIERSKLFDKETYAKNFFAALESIDYNH